MIPVKYNLRNLRVRWMTTLMTVLSTGLVVWASVLSFGLTDGLQYALKVTGHELDLIVVRKGATDEIGSGIEQKVAREVSSLPGIARGEQGQPLCSVEFVTILTKPRRNNGGTVNLIVRGLEQIGRSLRPDFKIVQGRDIEPGKFEALTSRSMAARFENLAIGEKLEVNRQYFEIVGYYEAAGSAAESEVWTDLRDLTLARKTPAAVSSICLRAESPEQRDSLIARLADDKRFQLNAIRETKYFEDQMNQANAIQYIGYIIAGFLIFGAMFAAANTMYAAVASRAREIGTLRALGFPRGSILVSFLFEAVVLCLLGGLAGCLATLPFNGLSTGTINQFSEITFSFRFGPRVLAQGVLLALVMGLLGGILPAIRAVRLNIISALRER
ncbi:MAG: ABC transporter permease [Planctomycetaceae bacterium]|nr:ABC transporter permease [Planctomycetaceae bacterium]